MARRVGCVQPRATAAGISSLKQVLLQQVQQLELAHGLTGRGPLEVEVGRPDVPTAVDLADRVRGGNAYVLEKVSLNSAASCICTSGRTVMPGVSIIESR